jgi:NAD(P)-dependent dehydrogenase (short-subunit alcohol dehydrogenase family)
MKTLQRQTVLISDPTSTLGRALAETFTRHGASLGDQNVDILVNVSDPHPDYRAAFEADVFRPLELIQAVAPAMIARRSGTIVSICSDNPSDVSKFALEGLSRCARIELHRHGIRVWILPATTPPQTIVEMIS